MKKIQIFIFSLSFMLSIGQNRNSTITYDFSFSFSDDFYNQLDQTRKNNFKEAERIAKLIEPKLVFNDSLAVFYSGEILDIDNKMALIIAKAFCKCKQKLFYRIKEKILYSESNENPFHNCDQCLIYKPMSINWELYNESKFINNYLCYKATQNITYKSGEKELINKVTAWYCPEIPYSIGPKGYGGLPGLIFELHEKEGSYGIVSIELNNNDDMKIEIPKYKKLISHDEYYKSFFQKVEDINSQIKN